MVEFGGIKAPLCKLAISYDGNKFYFKEVNSRCVKMKNSKNVNIVCNIRKKSKQQVCKTYKELQEFVINNRKNINVKCSDEDKVLGLCN